MKYIKLFLVCLLLLLTFTSCRAIGETIISNYLIDYISDKGDLESRVYIQPDGPFSIYTFPEMAQGNYIGIVFHGTMSSPIVGKWKMDDRFWQDGSWSLNVNNFAWGFKGKNLYVGTSNIYGDGGLYKVDLYNKTYIQLFPTAVEEQNDYIEVVISDITKDKIKIQVNQDGKKYTKTFSILN